MQDIELLSYLLLFGLGLIFSILGVSRKSSIFCFFSFIPWFTLGMVQPYMANGTVFVGLAYLWYGIGFLFIVFGITLTMLSFLATQKEKNREEFGEFG